ncbi:MAG: GntR family transcriptional regulator [Pseudorhodoplanes sp.]|nr:GntR family transcriptional regulator [Pseudorhodoplanes sp.]
MSKSFAASITQPSWSADVEAIATAFARGLEAGMPRYLQLQNTVTRLIQAGELRAGGQLPPDQQLTAALGISLGTVQKALSNLASEGWITREHGRGTFIAEPRRSVTEPWHYRFVNPHTGELLPVYSSLLQRRQIPANEFLRKTLGDDTAGYIEIERLIDIDGKFACHSQLCLSARRFARILDLPAATFNSFNLKQLFADEFGAPTISVVQSVRALIIPADIAALIGVGKRSAGMLLEVLARGYGRAPLSFQRIHIPATDYPLDVSPILEFQRTTRAG